MIRHALAVAVALCVSPAWLYAQGAQLTVNTASATVYKGPSVGSAVIGQAPRGTVLEVTRELGDWVKVSWPSVPDASGYIRLTAGTLSRGATTQPLPTAAAGYTPEPAMALNGAAPQGMSQPAPTSSPISRVMSFGGRMGGSALGFGGAVRGWSRNRLGLQVEVSRYSLTSPIATGRVTTMEIAPSVLYSLPNRVGDYVWLRPYVGGGLNLQRSTQSGFGSASKTGFQAFGGGEFTFAGAPRLAVSTDVGYRKANAPYEGFELGDVRLSVGAHWYLK
jgi:hypothetical protein